jgi:hypothetical protein
MKLTKKQLKGRQTPTALSHESLLTKSRKLARRSLESKEAGNLDESQLWASIALELLAKASLSSIHPSLIVETDNLNSLLEASGINTRTPVRTIKANDTYVRLKHTVPHFGTLAFEACKKLAERRNAELHSGEAALASVPPIGWEGDYWNAAELILNSMNSDLREWLGADSKAPQELLKNLRSAKKQAAIERVKQRSAEFSKPSDGGKRTKKEIEEIHARSKALRPNDHIGDFQYLYAEYWLQECPACKSFGIAAGDEAYEDLAEDQSDADYGFEIIERGFDPIEFHCPSCKLSLVGEEALNAVGITEQYIETQESEIQYEPDYGND